jgi:hypothetical protein
MIYPFGGKKKKNPCPLEDEKKKDYLKKTKQVIA